jgi:large subunit ribosomal protein L29
MATQLSAHELDEMTNADLETKLRESKEELFNLRFQSATGQLENHGRLRAVKRDIARIYTVLRERELGIRPDVVAPVEEAKTEKAGKKSKKASTKDEESVETQASEEDAK